MKYLILLCFLVSCSLTWMLLHGPVIKDQGLVGPHEVSSQIVADLAGEDSEPYRSNESAWAEAWSRYHERGGRANELFLGALAASIAVNVLLFVALMVAVVQRRVMMSKEGRS